MVDRAAVRSLARIVATVGTNLKVVNSLPSTVTEGEALVFDGKLWVGATISGITTLIPVGYNAPIHTHTQIDANLTWVITHNLDVPGVPEVAAADYLGQQVVPLSVVSTSRNVTTVTFAQTMAGSAVLIFDDIQTANVLKASEISVAGTSVALVGHQQPFSSLTSVPTTLAGYGITDAVSSSQLAGPNGVATLGSDGKVLSTQLPSYVDDVVEYPNLVSFPIVGESGIIYVAVDTSKTYRWSGSTYTLISSGAVDSVAGKTGVVVLVKSDVGLGSVDNTSDINKPISSATQIALDLKAPSSHIGSAGDAHGIATPSLAGFLSSADKTKLDGIAVNANNFVLPVATPSVLGGIKIGTDFVIDGNGVLALSTLPSLNLSGRLTSTGRLLLGDEVDNPNLANVWVANSASGVTADRTITVVDSIGVLKVVRAHDTNNPAVELQEWNAALDVQRGYWDWASINGDFYLRDRLNPAITYNRMWINRTTGVMSVDGLSLPKEAGSAIFVGGTYGWATFEGTTVPRTGGGGVAPTNRVFQGVTRGYSYSVGNLSDTLFVLPSDYIPGTEIFLKVVWSHNGTNISGTLVLTMGVSYAKGYSQEVFSTPKTLVLTTPTLNITNTPRYSNRNDTLQMSTPGGSASLVDTSLLEPGGVLQVNLDVTTIPSITGSGISNTPYIFSVGLQYQSSGLPTKNRLPNFYA